MAGLCAAAIVALYVDAILDAGYRLQENLAIVLLLAQFWLLLRYRTTRHPVFTLGCWK